MLVTYPGVGGEKSRIRLSGKLGPAPCVLAPCCTVGLCGAVSHSCCSWGDGTPLECLEDLLQSKPEICAEQSVDKKNTLPLSGFLLWAVGVDYLNYVT